MRGLTLASKFYFIHNHLLIGSRVPVYHKAPATKIKSPEPHIGSPKEIHLSDPFAIVALICEITGTPQYNSSLCQPFYNRVVYPDSP